MLQTFDIAIVGAGPAGCACAIQLAKALPALRIVLLEKAQFPRDKICGDALSPDVVNQCRILSEELAAQLDRHAAVLPIKGLKIAGRRRKVFVYRFASDSPLKGYTCARLDLDALIFAETRHYPQIHYRDCAEVKDLQVLENGVRLETAAGGFQAHMVVGADGAHSVVGRKLGRVKMDKNYHAGGLRVYYEGIAGLEDQLIELHYLNEVLPGYLWIFPLPGNRANVGLGMLSRQISEGQIHLRQVLQDILEKDPVLKERFAGARPLEPVKGFGLPLGGKRNRISGNRDLLLGDAASLIDPLTGEGIANALRSGRIAATHIEACLAQQDFSEAFNQAYDREIYRRMMPELRVNYRLLQILHYWPASLDLFIFLSNRMKGLRTNLMDTYLWLHRRVSRSR